MHPQQKVLQDQEFSSMGWLKIFWVKGKKPRIAGLINLIFNSLKLIFRLRSFVFMIISCSYNWLCPSNFSFLSKGGVGRGRRSYRTGNHLKGRDVDNRERQRDREKERETANEKEKDIGRFCLFFFNLNQIKCLK